MAAVPEPALFGELGNLGKYLGKVVLVAPDFQFPQSRDIGNPRAEGQMIEPAVGGGVPSLIVPLALGPFEGDGIVRILCLTCTIPSRLRGELSGAGH
jgi:hypothetical protein